ncbi:hypothetical protein O181_054050 [Austropuccinia psidii MF-1]|uniref:Tf2-1-like SH3-like domain-containing protein n=1 Tax=Austropuccinia psidii MF-1 TaxID=1389203 RepID=A0A9Q3E1P7_9BASI|nr:hypothetical protein [Austropuccinia psidii MF-1]
MKVTLITGLFLYQKSNWLITQRACDTAAKCIAEAKEYKKKRWDRSQIEPDFKEGDQVLVPTLNFNNLKGTKKTREPFLGPFTIVELIGKNAVEVKLTEEFSRKQPVFPVSLFKPCLQTEEDKFPSRKKNPTPPEIVTRANLMSIVGD